MLENNLSNTPSFELLMNMTERMFMVLAGSAETNFFNRVISADQVELMKNQYENKFDMDLKRSRYFPIPGCENKTDEEYLDVARLYIHHLPCHPILKSMLIAYCHQSYLINPITDAFNRCFMHSGFFLYQPQVSIDLIVDEHDANRLTMLIKASCFEIVRTNTLTGIMNSVEDRLDKITLGQQVLPFKHQVEYDIRVVNSGLQFVCKEFAIRKNTTLPTAIAEKINPLCEIVTQLLPHIERIPSYYDEMKSTLGRDFVGADQLPLNLWYLILGCNEHKVFSPQELANFSAKLHRIHYEWFYNNKDMPWINATIYLHRPLQNADFRSQAPLKRFYLKLVNTSHLSSRIQIDFSGCPNLQLNACRFDGDQDTTVHWVLYNCPQIEFDHLMVFLLLNPVINSVEMQPMACHTPIDVQEQLIHNKIWEFNRSQLYHIFNHVMNEKRREHCFNLIGAEDQGLLRFLKSELSKQRQQIRNLSAIHFADYQAQQFTCLNLSETELTDLDCLALNQAKNLKQLFIAHNKVLELPDFGELDQLVQLDMHGCTNLRGVEMRAPKIAIANFDDCPYFLIEWLGALLATTPNLHGVSLSLRHCEKLSGHAHIAGQCYSYEAADLVATPHLIPILAAKLAVDQLVVTMNPLRPTISRPLCSEEPKMQETIKTYFQKLTPYRSEIQNYISEWFKTDDSSELLTHLNSMLQALLAARQVSRNSGLFLRLLTSQDESSKLAFYQYVLSYMLVEPAREGLQQTIKYRKLAVDFIRLYYCRENDPNDIQIKAVIYPVLQSIFLQLLYSHHGDERFAFIRSMLDPAYVIDDPKLYLDGNARLVWAFMHLMMPLWSAEDYLDQMQLIAIHLSDAQLANFVLLSLFGWADEPFANELQELEKQTLVVVLKCMQEPGILVGQAISYLSKDSMNLTNLNIVHTALDLLYARIDKTHWHEKQWQGLMNSIRLFNELTSSDYGFKSTLPSRKVTDLNDRSKTTFNYTYSFTQRIEILTNIFSKTVGDKRTSSIIYPLAMPIMQSILQNNVVAVQDFFDACKESSKLYKKLGKSQFHLDDLIFRLKELQPIMHSINQNNDDDGPVVVQNSVNLLKLAQQIDADNSPILCVDSVRGLLRALITTTSLRALLKHVAEKGAGISVEDFFDILAIVRFYSDFAELGTNPKNRSLKMFSKHITAEELKAYSVVSELFVAVRTIVVSYVMDIKQIDIDTDLDEIFSLKGTTERGLEWLLRKLSEECEQPKIHNRFYKF